MDVWNRTISLKKRLPGDAMHHGELWLVFVCLHVAHVAIEHHQSVSWDRHTGDRQRDIEKREPGSQEKARYTFSELKRSDMKSSEPSIWQWHVTCDGSGTAMGRHLRACTTK